MNTCSYLYSHVLSSMYYSDYIDIASNRGRSCIAPRILPLPSATSPSSDRVSLILDSGTADSATIDATSIADVVTLLSNLSVFDQNSFERSTEKLRARLPISMRENVFPSLSTSLVGSHWFQVGPSRSRFLLALHVETSMSTLVRVQTSCSPAEVEYVEWKRLVFQNCSCSNSSASSPTSVDVEKDLCTIEYQGDFLSIPRMCNSTQG